MKVDECCKLMEQNFLFQDIERCRKEKVDNEDAEPKHEYDVRASRDDHRKDEYIGAVTTM